MLINVRMIWNEFRPTHHIHCFSRTHRLPRPLRLRLDIHPQRHRRPPSSNSSKTGQSTYYLHPSLRCPSPVLDLIITNALAFVVQVDPRIRPYLHPFIAQTRNIMYIPSLITLVNRVGSILESMFGAWPCQILKARKP